LDEDTDAGMEAIESNRTQIVEPDHIQQSLSRNASTATGNCTKASGSFEARGDRCEQDPPEKFRQTSGETATVTPPVAESPQKVLVTRPGR
ncbi:MAG TPA: hypothetical protein VMM37_09750, partial [Bacteroidota bacterium]|nr:hypothetical protein [Bacteroidota bacterium]